MSAFKLPFICHRVDNLRLVGVPDRNAFASFANLAYKDGAYDREETEEAPISLLVMRQGRVCQIHHAYSSGDGMGDAFLSSYQ